MANDRTEKTTYRGAGVDIDAGHRAVDGMREAVGRTHGPEVLAGVGAFGGLFALTGLGGMTEPVLAASTDGVGTKVRLAARHDRLDTLGHDLVNHCVNDILVQGARPLFFLDYVASSVLDPDQIVRIVSGMAAACKATGVALLGGETAEMPGVYADGELDVVGTIVGAVDRDAIIDGTAIQPGDVVLGLASDSPHTNGYSLIRQLVGERDLTVVDAALGEAPLDLLLTPHRCYLPDVSVLLDRGLPIHGLVHVTGGGLIDNPPRILPHGVAVAFDRTGWEVPPLYPWLASLGDVSDAEMHRVFNMGLGLLVVVPADRADEVLAVLPTPAWRVGTIVAHEGPPTVLFTPPLS